MGKSFKKSGFTLIEMLVAISVFSIIMTIVLGAILSLDYVQKRTASIRAVQDNLSYALGIMSREIRTGRNYLVYNDSGYDGIEFENAQGGTVIYAFTNDIGSPDVYRNRVLRDDQGNAPAVWIPVTDEKVTIDYLNFDIRDSFPNDQPLVIIKLGGSMGSGKTASDLELQTTVSQRIPDQ